MKKMLKWYNFNMKKKNDEGKERRSWEDNYDKTKKFRRLINF